VIAPRVASVAIPAFAKTTSSFLFSPLDLCEETIQIAKIRHVPLYAGHISSDIFHRRRQLRIPKYRKAVLTGEVAVRVRDLLRPIAAEHELEIVSGKVARDHVHLFLSYRLNQQVSQIMQWLKGISSRVLLQEFPLGRLPEPRHGKARGHHGNFRITLETLISSIRQSRFVGRW
jgi:hypothetical protein